MRILLIIIISSFIAKGQDIHFSQFSKSIFFLNPSILAYQHDDYKINLHTKSQWKSVAKPYKTTTFSVEINDIIPTHSLAIQVLNDIAGDAYFKTAGLNIIYCKSIGFSDLSKLSFAAGLGFFQRSLLYDNLIFNEIEQYQNINFWFPDVSIGLSHQKKINKKVIIRNGVSLFHLNNPRQSLTGVENVRLHKRVNFHSSINYSLNNENYIIPRVFFSNQLKNREIIFVIETKHLYSKKKEIIFNPGISYRLHDAMIFMLGVEFENIECSVSYDYNISNLRKASNYKGGLEFSICYFWNKKKKNGEFKVKEACPKYF